MATFCIKSLCVVAGVSLAACGGGGGTSPTTEFRNPAEDLDSLDPTTEAEARLAEIAARGASFTDLINRNRNPTPATNIPTTGVATFAGVAAINTGSNVAINLLGDATVEINFANDTFTGTLDEFFGTQGDFLDIYNGSLDITNGVVGPNGIRANIGARYDGTLTGNGSTLVFDGVLFGNLQNDRLSALQLTSNPNAGSFDEVAIDGTDRPLLLGITAECTAGC